MEVRELWAATVTPEEVGFCAAAQVVRIHRHFTELSTGEESDETVLGISSLLPQNDAAQGESNLDCRSDVYSLGATLYRVVTGQIPFGDVKGTAPMVKHVTDQLDDPRDLNPDVTANAASLIRKMMAKDRQHRQNGWAEVLTDIRSVREGRKPSSLLDPKIKSTIKFLAAGRAAGKEVRQVLVARQARTPGQGDSYETAVADLKSAIQFHVETFGTDVLEVDPPVLEAFIAETGVPV